MDNYMQTFRDKFFDRDGLLASKGKINLDFTNNFLKDAFLKKIFLSLLIEMSLIVITKITENQFVRL